MAETDSLFGKTTALTTVRDLTVAIAVSIDPTLRDADHRQLLTRFCEMRVDVGWPNQGDAGCEESQDAVDHHAA